MEVVGGEGSFAFCMSKRVASVSDVSDNLNLVGFDSIWNIPWLVERVMRDMVIPSFDGF